MTALLDIQPHQWVLAFDQPFGPHDRTMEEHLAMFTSRGGGWDSIEAREIFLVHQVQRATPKTYQAVGGLRFPRSNVIAVGQSQEAMTALRDKLFAIGDAADDRIEAEMHRRVASFSVRERAQALKKIHACLPHIFGRDA